MTFQEIKNSIQDKITLQDNTVILEDINQLQIDSIENGILTIWTTWSLGHINCIDAITHLYYRQYSGQITIIDSDSISTDFQTQVFGKVALHGWGEIFVIKNGHIIKEFIGQDSSSNFKTYFDQSAES